jgi:hypothetical protein
VQPAARNVSDVSLASCIGIECSSAKLEAVLARGVCVCIQRSATHMPDTTAEAARRARAVQAVGVLLEGVPARKIGLQTEPVKGTICKENLRREWRRPKPPRLVEVCSIINQHNNRGGPAPNLQTPHKKKTRCHADTLDSISPIHGQVQVINKSCMNDGEAHSCWKAFAKTLELRPRRKVNI